MHSFLLSVGFNQQIATAPLDECAARTQRLELLTHGLGVAEDRESPFDPFVRALPAGPVPEPFVSADDIADVAAATMTNPALRNRIFEVTGPRALTFAEAVDIIATAADRPVIYQQISTRAFAETLAPYLPPEVIAQALA